MIVSTRDASASSCRPEKASTRELRSSIVTGASSSAPTALATANRSPDGSPPIDSASVVPDVVLGEERAQQRGELAHVAPRRRPSRASPASSHRRVERRGSSPPAHGRPARRRPGVRALADEVRRASADRTPTPSTSARRWLDRLVVRVVDDDAADLAARARGRRATSSSRCRPRSSRTRPQARTGPLVHRDGLIRADGPPVLGSRSERDPLRPEVVTGSRISGIGRRRPRPGPGGHVEVPVVR